MPKTLLILILMTAVFTVHAKSQDPNGDLRTRCETIILQGLKKTKRSERFRLHTIIALKHVSLKRIEEFLFEAIESGSIEAAVAAVSILLEKSPGTNFQWIPRETKTYFLPNC